MLPTTTNNNKENNSNNNKEIKRKKLGANNVMSDTWQMRNIARVNILGNFYNY